MVMDSPYLKRPALFLGWSMCALAMFGFDGNVYSSDQKPAADLPITHFEPGIDLPEGKARPLLLDLCTRCHDLKGIPAFKGYWNRQQWMAMVEIMVKHGAKLDEQQAHQVADYLNEHFGRESGK